MAKPSIKGLRTSAVSFSSLPGWSRDHHEDALAAFRVSCQKMDRGRDALGKVCRAARKLPRNVSSWRARAFFESHFAPHKVRSGRRGLLTGYYEPELRGSRVKTAEYPIPLYRRPADLVGIHSGAMRRKARRAGLPRKMTYARRKSNGALASYMTREQIERGGLDGRNLEMLYLADPVDVFFLHIQGSGRIVLPDGSHTRIGFDGKNGYGYTSIGRYLVRSGALPASKVSLDNVKAWLRSNPEAGRRAMWHNKSFIFFREIALKNSTGPIGAQGVSLIGGRSLAVDRRHYRLGVPIFLSVPGLRNDGQSNMRRLMIAQDTGTAIKGSRRGDIFWGSGDEAGRIAGGTYHKGDFYVLLPRSRPIRVNAALYRDQAPAPRLVKRPVLRKKPVPAKRQAKQKAASLQAIGRQKASASSMANIRIVPVKVRRISVEKYLKSPAQPKAAAKNEAVQQGMSGMAGNDIAAIDFERVPVFAGAQDHEFSSFKSKSDPQ